MKKALELMTTCALCALPLVMACSHEEQTPQGGYGQTNVQPAAPDRAIDRIASARCDLEQSCNNVGYQKKYQSRDACMNKERGDLAGDIRTDQCPNGVDNRQLDKCVSEIRGERCGNVLDTAGRMNACRTSELCMR